MAFLWKKLTVSLKKDYLGDCIGLMAVRYIDVSTLRPIQSFYTMNSWKNPILNKGKKIKNNIILYQYKVEEFLNWKLNTLFIP